MQGKFSDVGFLGFDVYGTVVDWRTSIARESEGLLKKYGIHIDPLTFAEQWRSYYQPSMEPIRAGQRAFVTLDVLNQENLTALLKTYGVDRTQLKIDEFAHWVAAWERLTPWPDSVEGLTRLKRKFAIGPISNGHIAGMMHLARYAKLPWDAILGAGLTNTYKPQHQTYLKSAMAVGLAPQRMAMIAAHNDDLAAARACGFKTVYVNRPTEYGPNQTKDLNATGDWDHVVGSITEAADALGC
nr:HAD-IA family hydrolase [Pseudomonas graminis]